MPDDVFQFKNAKDSSGFLLWGVSSLWQRKINAGLRPFDLTHAQFVLLASLLWLGNKSVALTQAELASHTRMDTMMVSNVLRTLESKGLLTRKPHPSDTRAKSLALTSKGQKLAEQVVPVVENIDQQFFSQLGANTAKFNQNLAKLIEANQME
ncbi:MAG: MarR family transcriptional protein [Chloroflexi bacterium OLB14]|nr:MAG: MarR family transcriptional protein [Chloroflexi bacterium OLB14]